MGDSGEFPRRTSEGEREFEGYASRAMLERYHTDQKAAHSHFTREIETLKLKTQELSFGIAACGERLNNGAATFTRHDDRLAKVEDMKRPQWKTVMGIVLVVIPWIWAAAKYPDGAKFEELQRQVNQMQIQQERFQGTMELKLTAIDAKVSNKP